MQQGLDKALRSGKARARAPLRFHPHRFSGHEEWHTAMRSGSQRRQGGWGFREPREGGCV